LYQCVKSEQKKVSKLVNGFK